MRSEAHGAARLGPASPADEGIGGAPLAPAARLAAPRVVGGRSPGTPLAPTGVGTSLPPNESGGAAEAPLT